MGESWWDDFSNNLATDLAPLIALFGEAPTKQYLSECLTAVDIIIFAAAPLGVITAVVSAVRVCGTPSLRAFIGRGKEGAGNAEAELCSSTSRDVCELYSDGGIARVFGRPKLLEVIHDPLAPREEFYTFDENKATAGIYSFREHMERKGGEKDWYIEIDYKKKQGKSSGENEAGNAEETPMKFAPNPNLSLNIGIKPLARGWFLAAAIIGCISQLFVLVWAALTRYYYQWIRHSAEDNYAIPLTVIGTVLLCLGMALCANLIEAKTGEQAYQRAKKPGSNNKSKLYWVQPGNQVVGDQVFESFAYSDEEHTLSRYYTSWKKETDDPNVVWIWAAVGMSSFGFIFQFLGLRACHSSVAVVQLGVTILMSLIRAGLRTKRLRREDNLMWASPHFFQGHELDFLALKLGLTTRDKSATSKQTSACKASYDSEIQSRCSWGISSISQSSNVDLRTRSSTATSHISNTHEGDRVEVVEKLPNMSERPPTLTGFRIKDQAVKQDLNPLENLLNDADKDILSWILMTDCAGREAGHDCSVENCETDVNIAVKTLFYRSRLARMTGVEELESERSSYWGGKFVSVRDTAMILGNAIEDTMQILFASNTRPPIKLQESWEHTFRMFWTVHCYLHKHPEKGNQHGDIHMSLRREIDQNGTPNGPWRSNRSELEAMLGLWSWSLKEPPKKQEEEKAYSRRTTGQRISRILSAYKNPENEFDKTQELNMWRGSGDLNIQKRQLKIPDKSTPSMKGDNTSKILTNTSLHGQHAVWWRDNGVFVTTPDGAPDNSHEQRRFFGWCNVEESLCRDIIDVLEIKSESSLMLNCAQEIYSIFLDAIIQVVDDIGGATQLEQHEDRCFLTNDTIQNIRSALVTRGLCSAEDSFACVIPILNRHDKLHQKAVTQVRDPIQEIAQGSNWKNVMQLALWASFLSYSRVDRRRNQQHGATKSTKDANDLRLPILIACDAFLRGYLRTASGKRILGIGGYISLLGRYSQDEVIKEMSLVWTDRENVLNQRLPQHTLADAIRSYGEVMMWCLNENPRSSAEEKRQYRMLKEYFTESRPTPTGLTDNPDLSTSMFLLYRRRLNPAENIRLLSHASRLGWYMVIEMLVEMAVSADETYNTDLNALLSDAAKLGDINTARVLMRMGATLGLTGTRSNRRGALHYAAKEGHTIIIEDMLNKYGDSSIGNEDRDGITPLTLAIKSGNPSVVELLTKNAHRKYLNSTATKYPPLHLAIEEGHGDIVDVLLDIDALDVNFKSRWAVDSPPLVCAVRLRKELIFEKILNSARVDVYCSGMGNRSALWWAAALGLDSYVQKLLDSGKALKSGKKGQLGNTALSMAVQLGHLGVVDQLLKVQAAGTVRLKDILIAAKNGHTQVVEEMLPRKVKDKNDAQHLLEKYRLEKVWRDIQNSENWQKAGEQGETQFEDATTIGYISKRDVQYALQKK